MNDEACYRFLEICFDIQQIDEIEDDELDEVKGYEDEETGKEFDFRGERTTEFIVLHYFRSTPPYFKKANIASHVAKNKEINKKID